MAKTKSFDCMEMKRAAQARLRAEYAARKDEFASYTDFIGRTARQSPLYRRWFGARATKTRG